VTAVKKAAGRQFSVFSSAKIPQVKTFLFDEICD